MGASPRAIEALSMIIENSVINSFSISKYIDKWRKLLRERLL